MQDRQRGSPAARGVSEEETQQEGNPRSDAFPIGETEETFRSESFRREGSSASFSQADNTLCALSVGAAGGPATPRRGNLAASDAHNEESHGDGDMKRPQASSVGEGTENTIRSEQQQLPSETDGRATRLETNAAANATKKVKEEHGEAGAAAAEERRVVDTTAAARETAYVGDALTAEEVRGAALCATCGTRAELVACADCRRLFHAACGADAQAAPNVFVSRLCRVCRVESSRGRENTSQENGVRKTVQEQNVLDKLGGGTRKWPAEGAEGSRSNHGGSDVQVAAKMGDAENAAADNTTEEAEVSEVQPPTRMLAEKEPGEDHGPDNEKLTQREKLRGECRAGEDGSFAARSYAPVGETQADSVSSKAERFARLTTGDTSGVEVEGKATKSDSTEGEAKSSTLAEDSVALAGEDIKCVEVSGTSANSTPDSSKCVADQSAAESSKPVTDIKSGLEDSSSTGDKEYDLESRRSADPSIAALETSKSASESKDGVTITQEGGGSGAEDEDEEEEGELLQGGLSGESEKKEYMASRKRGGESVSRGKPTSPRSLSPSPCHYRRKRRRGENGAVATRCKVNVGPRHQVPALPPFFLDSSCTRDERAERLPETRELYSHDAGDTARLVYSPFAMQRVYRKRLAEGTIGEAGIRNADEMNDFIRKVAENWTNKSGWQPFSPEYAYKLLHFAGYDPQRALRIMKDSRFCFTTICDPPQRRYDNKWRPKDRRGQIATHPYPSPLTLRAYLSRRNQHAAATAAAENASSRG